MRHTYEEVQQLAGELPPEQRMSLANALLESVTPDELSDAGSGWEAEIQRRVEEIKAGTAATCSVHDLAADLRTILGS